MNPLIIPKYNKARKGSDGKRRGKMKGLEGYGQYVKCNKCCKEVSDTCKLTGKGIKTCQYGENHTFVSKDYHPIKKRMTIIKTWGSSLRNYDEFHEKHKLLLKTHQWEYEKVEPEEEKPLLLIECQAMFLEYKKPLTEDEREKLKSEKLDLFDRKPVSEKEHNAIRNRLRNCNNVLRYSGVLFGSLSVFNFTKKHVKTISKGITLKYSPKTYNKHMATFKQLFTFLIEKGYDLTNHFNAINYKPTEKKDEVITKEQFDSLRNLINKESGSFKRGDKNIQFYRPWLFNAFKLMLYTGCRRPELINIKVKDIDFESNILKVIDSKSTNKTHGRVVTYRYVKMIEDMPELLLYFSQGKAKDEFIISPENSRYSIETLLTDSFTHFVKPVYGLTLGCLRNTYITRMKVNYGDGFLKASGIHTNEKTGNENYNNLKEYVSSIEAKRFF